jgi:hypothetical protein
MMQRSFLKNIKIYWNKFNHYAYEWVTSAGKKKQGKKIIASLLLEYLEISFFNHCKGNIF